MSISNIHLLPKEEQDRLLGKEPEEKPKEEKKKKNE